MTPTTIETLFGTRREDISLSGDTLALNSRLKLPPWMPSAVAVWKEREPPGYLDQHGRQSWFEVLAILDDLYEEHQRRKSK